MRACASSDKRVRSVRVAWFRERSLKRIWLASALARIAVSFTISLAPERPAGRGVRCSRRSFALNASIMFSRPWWPVKYVRVTESDIAGPLCTQCGAIGGI